MGRSGTGWDVQVVEIMGHNVQSAAHAGRSIVEERKDEVHAVASHLEENKTLSGFEIRETIHNVREKTQEVEIVFEMPNGDRQKIEKQKARKGIVVFEKKWLEPQEKEKSPTSQHEVALAA